MDSNSDLYRLRLERNEEAARAALAWLKTNRPEAVIIPNGTILEFGALYQVARNLDLPVVTYEFGEQRQRIWLAQNAQVMRQETDDLWRARKDQPVSNAQIEQVRTMFSSRQRAAVWENFSRRWQGVPSEGGERARVDLQLDSRPVVLLATNVIGDSLILGRQIFSDTMTDWLECTVTYFSRRPDVQLVVRIHPGERYTQGPSVADVIAQTVPELPVQIHLVKADDPVNTYNLVELCAGFLFKSMTVEEKFRSFAMMAKDN